MKKTLFKMVTSVVWRLSLSEIKNNCIDLNILRHKHDMTNNYVEVSFRLMKDLLFGRTKVKYLIIFEGKCIAKIISFLVLQPTRPP